MNLKRRTSDALSQQPSLRTLFLLISPVLSDPLSSEKLDLKSTLTYTLAKT